MSEELENVLTETLEMTRAAGQWTVEQAPGIAQEMINYQIAQGFFLVAIWWAILAFIGVSIHSIRESWWNKSNEEYIVGVVIVVLLFQVFFSFIVIDVFMFTFKAIFSPRLFVIDEILTRLG